MTSYAVAQLQLTLVELIALSLAGKQLHWSAYGRAFLSARRNLDQLVEEWRELQDAASWTDLDACARALSAYWDALPGRQEPTQKGNGRWATGKPHAAPRNFARHGGFGVVKERARRLRAQSG